jgi:O-antigen ligase/polysaccharide polymerase Wzy-like membrane protein
MSVSAAEARSAPRTGAEVESWFSWTGAIALLVLVVWLVPIKSYTLPVHLPFSLELYRLLLIVFGVCWVVAALAGTKRMHAGGLGKPVALLAAVTTLSVIANMHAIQNEGLGTQAIKSLSYFLSFLLAYLLVLSTIDGYRAAHTVATSFVIGAVVVAVAALYESRTHYNVFHHLQQWVPIFKSTHTITENRIRGGRLRVTGSAQHPIALGAALTMAVPLSLYTVSRARTRTRQFAWWGVAAVIVAGALATVSRTVVSMALAVLVVGLLVRRREIVRRWPVLIVLALVVHVASPGAVSHLYRAFFPKQGLSSSLEGRSGAVGSGRVADIGPGIRSWKETPFLGHGLGTGKDPSTVGTGAIVDPETGAPIIFDDQYLNSLVSIGALGLLAVLWFVWGSVVSLLRRARRIPQEQSDLVVACAAAAAAFGVGMLTFDAFSFVQSTLIFFVLVALGLAAARQEPHEQAA